MIVKKNPFQINYWYNLWGIGVKFMTKLFSFMLITLAISGFYLVNVKFSIAQATDVPSVINSDTVWIKESSPYELKGPVLVSDGITLTIEPGITVNLNGHYLQVEGTLSAIGISSDQIFFNDGTIRFTTLSRDWNEQEVSGCIIQNSDLSNCQIDISNSPKIHNNSINEINVDGSPIISKNTISKISITGSPTILENYFTSALPGSLFIVGSPIISNNSINCRIIVTRGSPIISYNTINDGIHIDASSGSVNISNNIISIRGDYNIVHVQAVPGIILNNIIMGKGIRFGIYAFGSDDYIISYNIVSNCLIGINSRSYGLTIIEANNITYNKNGIRVEYYKPFHILDPSNASLIIRNNIISDNSEIGVNQLHTSASILNNTIANNNIGIEISQSALILYNNIFGNEYNLRSMSGGNINATLNWWGTIDVPKINQTIYDLKYDFNLGRVIFSPFLTEENLEIPEFSSWVILPLIVSISFVVLLIRKKWIGFE